MWSECSSFSAFSSWALNAATKRAVVSLDSVIASPPKEYREAEGQEGYCHPRPATARTDTSPRTQSRTVATIAENGCDCVLIFRGSSAHACYPSPRLPPSSTHRRPTYAGCCFGSDCTESKSESCGPFSRTTWKLSGARVALLAGRASYRKCH